VSPGKMELELIMDLRGRDAEHAFAVELRELACPFLAQPDALLRFDPSRANLLSDLKKIGIKCWTVSNEINLQCSEERNFRRDF
jgi:hypothetical protein